MDKKYYGFVGLYTFSYGALGMLLPLMGQYLDSIGFTGTQIGNITAAGTLVAIFASIFWGNVYSSSRDKYRLLIFLCLISAVSGLGLVKITTFIFFLLLYCLMYFFQSPLIALEDALMIENDQPFGKIRKWGAIGYASCVFVAGKAADTFGLSVIFFLFFTGFFITAVILLFIRSRRQKELDIEPARDEGHAVKQPDALRHLDTGKQGDRERLKELFHNERYIKVLICAFFLLGTNVANNTYFSFLYIEGGGNIMGVGLAFLLMAGSEAPFMAWSKRLSEKFTLEKTLLVAMILSALRFAWYSTQPSSVLLLALFFIQGAVNGILLVEFVRYVGKLVRPELLGIAISMYYALSSNGSTIFCQMIGGRILDYSGSGGIYLFFSIYNMIGVLLYLFFGLHKEIKTTEGAA